MYSDLPMVDNTEDLAMLAESEIDDYVEPTKFKEAWDHEDPKQREKW